ncbi:MAG: BrnT family toxin [Deltaproteobacteria bacterium]|nr:BrnT family toxin [Deltaproteobacteria bacterium]MBW2649447.1 BrnT family toxin [Deltaproteobacteria bacterium]
MNFEWDDTKRKSNIKKHGIDFINAQMVFAGYTLTIEDDRYDYGEERFVTFGILEGRVVVVVHTETENLIRIISIRKATKYEEKAYFSQIPD